MTDKEALDICRNQGRSMRDAKSILRWAASDPTPNKIPPLLLLNSNLFAARKKIYGELEEVLIRCAEEDSSSLWDCLEHDWDLDRQYLALDVLVKRPGVDRDRLIRLLSERTGSLLWNPIKRWADVVGFLIPNDIIMQQQKWERELSESHDTKLSAYADLEKRKPLWPADKDLGAASTKPMVRSPEYDEAATELTLNLDRILGLLERSGPELVDSLQPGLTANQIDEHAAALPFILPSEAYELYRWRNGSVYGQATLLPWFWFMPLGDAVKHYKATRDIPKVRKNWFPLFDWNGDEVICLVCESAKAPRAEVVRHDYESGTTKCGKSLTDFIRKTADSYKSGLYFVNEKGEVSEKE